MNGNSQESNRFRFFVLLDDGSEVPATRLDIMLSVIRMEWSLAGQSCPQSIMDAVIAEYHEHPECGQLFDRAA